MKILKYPFAAGIVASGLTLASVAGADQALAQSKGCMACHQVEVKIVGPAYREVAAKYKAETNGAEILVGKLKAGGVGNWGQIPMPPQPALSDAEAMALVDWIMTL